MTPKREYHKLTINISPDVADELRKLAADDDMTLTELFKRAIVLYRFVRAHKDAPFLIEKDGETMRIVFL